jgi:hypothetical protein
MKLPPRLALVPAAASTTTSNVIHISGIRSHGPAVGGAVTGPWPRQAEWRKLMHRIVKNLGGRGPGNSGER